MPADEAVCDNLTGGSVMRGDIYYSAVAGVAMACALLLLSVRSNGGEIPKQGVAKAPYQDDCRNRDTKGVCPPQSSIGHMLLDLAVSGKVGQSPSQVSAR